MCTFNFMAVKEGCYMGLHGEAVNGKEWAIRIMGNIITFGEKKEASLTLLKLLYPTEKDQQISKNDVNEILKELLNWNWETTDIKWKKKVTCKSHYALLKLFDQEIKGQMKDNTEK